MLTGRRRTWAKWLGLAAAALVAVWAGDSASVWLWRHRLTSLECQPPPQGMVLVPAGWFQMGSDDPEAFGDERPLRRVFVPAFYIDIHEVTNQEYRGVFPRHKCAEDEGDLPVTLVHKSEAEAYCRAVGKRLPTSAEWEKAARGTDGRDYPWGNDFRPECANVRPSDEGPRRKAPVGSFPCGVSPYGCHDTCGNVWEWVSTNRVERLWFEFPPRTIRRGILRGGAYGYAPEQCRTWVQAFEDLKATCHDTGFRCAMDAIPRGG